MEGIMDDDEKEKSVIGKMVDGVTSAVGDAVKAVMPIAKPDTEEIAERTNEQMLIGDAAIAPEAIPAPIAPVKTVRRKRTAPSRANKRVAAAAKAKATQSPAKKAAAKKAAPKKTVKKSAPKKAAKKSAKKAAKKTNVKKSGKKSAKKASKKKSKR
jgi:pantothenate synthetase